MMVWLVFQIVQKASQINVKLVAEIFIQSYRISAILLLLLNKFMKNLNYLSKYYHPGAITKAIHGTSSLIPTATHFEGNKRKD